MSTTTNLIWDIRSQNVLENGYVMNTAVTEKQMEEAEEAEEAIRCGLIRPQLKFYFHEAPSLIKIGSIRYGSVAAKHYFSTVRLLAALYCIFELFKDTLEET